MSPKSSQAVSRLKRKRDTSPDSADTSPSSSELEQEQAEDVPVLSHAARRKQKKKAAPNKTPTKKHKKEEDDSHSIKRQNSVWVGNLCYKTTPEALRRFFDGVGEITRVHLPTKLGNASPAGEPARRENRGFAYVDFATPDAKQVAIAMSESPLDGRRLLIKDGDSFEGRPAPAKPGTSLELETGVGAARGRGGQTKFAQEVLSAQKWPPAPTLFFGNLGFETTVDSIRGLLEAHKHKEKEVNANAAAAAATTSESAAAANDDGGANGADDDGGGGGDPWIRKIRMGTFEDSGQCKGFAFVDFTSVEGATAALIHSKNHQLDGRKLVVEYASADAVRRGGGAGRKWKPKSASTEAPKESHARSERRDSTMGDDGVRGKNDVEMTITSSKSQEERSTVTGRGNGAYAKLKPKVEHRRHKSRPTPGAALALAKREQVAIVPSQGRRITFDDS